MNYALLLLAPIFGFSLSGWLLKDLRLSCLDTLENILICLQEWFDDVFHKVTHQGWLYSKANGLSDRMLRMVDAHTRGGCTLRVVSSTFHVTCVICHNVADHGWSQALMSDHRSVQSPLA